MEKGQSALTQERLDLLATLSRVNILVMSAPDILVFVYLIARFYYADSMAGFFASLSLAVTRNFVYYSHTTCVDIPSMFWITLGVYFLLKSVYSGKLFHHIMMAIAFACACCTKDPMLFYAAAFALAYIVLRVDHLRRQGLDFKAMSSFSAESEYLDCAGGRFYLSLPCFRASCFRRRPTGNGWVSGSGAGASRTSIRDLAGQLAIADRYAVVFLLGYRLAAAVFVFYLADIDV